MQTRRQFLTLTGAAVAAVVPALLASPALQAATERAHRRPARGERKLVSAAVEERLARVRASIADPELAWLFENCYPNTLDTTVVLGELDGKPDTFILTGDIPAMWLRDSSAQVWPYVPLAAADEALKAMFRGLIQRHARCISIDPYANAFQQDPQGTQPLSWAAADMTDMKPGVAERKWEIDSLCYPIRLAYGYWRATGDTVPFDEDWRAAMRRVVQTFREQQRLAGPGPYRFQRSSETPLDTLAGEGYGNPTRKVGLIHSMFRPSDDACVYPFLVPANLFAVTSLRQLATLVRKIHGDAALSNDCERLADE